MARGKNSFRQRDAARALKVARDGGISPGMIEIVCQDGTIFRVYGDNATPTQDAGAKEWVAEIEKLKGRGKG